MPAPVYLILVLELGPTLNIVHAGNDKVANNNNGHERMINFL